MGHGKGKGGNDIGGLIPVMKVLPAGNTATQVLHCQCVANTYKRCQPALAEPHSALLFNPPTLQQASTASSFKVEALGITLPTPWRQCCHPLPNPVDGNTAYTQEWRTLWLNYVTATPLCPTCRQCRSKVSACSSSIPPQPGAGDS